MNVVRVVHSKEMLGIVTFAVKSTSTILHMASKNGDRRNSVICLHLQDCRDNTSKGKHKSSKILCCTALESYCWKEVHSFVINLKFL